MPKHAFYIRRNRGAVRWAVVARKDDGQPNRPVYLLTDSLIEANLCAMRLNKNPDLAQPINPRKHGA